jgi:lysyl endopeptidase
LIFQKNTRILSDEPIVLFLLALFVFTPARGQVPHGGWPLRTGIEQNSTLRSSVDFFVDMPNFDLDSTLTIDNLANNRVGGLRFAHTFYTDIAPENAGTTFHTEDGTLVWRVGIRSSGAYSLNVLFSEFSLPKGAKVFLYNTDRSRVLGAFTCENKPEGGEFSVAPVEGDELIVEYQEPANAAFSGKIRISEVNHDYRGLFRSGTRFNYLDQPCVPDLSCNAAYDTIGRSVCLLIINGNTYATGTLINNTAKDGKPYLITAAHCLSNKASNGTRVVAFFNYGSPRCNKGIRGSEEFSVSGSVTRAISKEVDFALLELTELPPVDYRPYLAGWSLDTTTANALPFTGIHHPYGEVKKYCLEEDSVIMADWASGSDIEKGNHWYISQWNIGHTWEGSSGSALFDKYNRFRGGLTGGGSGGPISGGGCQDYGTNEGDFYFRLDRGWNQFPDSSKQLKHWLDPLSSDEKSSTVTTIDGMDPYETNPARRISNLAVSDTMGKIDLDKPGWGSIFGHNSLTTTDFVEHFTIQDSNFILGTYLIAAKGHNNSQLPVTVKVYAGGDLPGPVLDSAVLNPHYIDYVSGDFVSKTKNYFTNRENYIRFDTPISVGTDFYIGYTITYPISSTEDSFYVYAAIREENTITNTAFFKYAGNWLPYTSHPEKPVNTTLWIEPVIAKDSVISYNNTEDKLTSNPILVWSSSESILYVSFPDEWIGETSAELFDLTGKKMLRTTLMPPLGTIQIQDISPKMLILRLKNSQTTCSLKIIISQP